MNYTEPTLIELASRLTDEAGVLLYLLREDQNHPHISGNKWWKLKYNLEQAKKEGETTLLTFGGAYSNHLYATAAAAAELGFQSIGIVRGEETPPINPTLGFAKNKGMRLHFISREDYKRKSDSKFVDELHNKFGAFYLIPEGGTNALAIKGCEEWALKIKNQIDFDYLCLPVGTGGTTAGMINKVPDKKVIGFSSLKGGTFLEKEIKNWLTTPTTNWKIETDYHFGGYGKVDYKLKSFILEFEKENGIPLDPIYTAKMLFGIYDKIKQNAFEKGSKILAIHTGGLQGRSGFSF